MTVKKIWFCCVGYSGLLSTCLAMEQTNDESMSLSRTQSVKFQQVLAKADPSESAQKEPKNAPYKNHKSGVESPKSLTVKCAFVDEDFGKGSLDNLLLKTTNSVATEYDVTSKEFDSPAKTDIKKATTLPTPKLPNDLPKAPVGAKTAVNQTTFDLNCLLDRSVPNVVWIDNFRVDNWKKINSQIWEWLELWFPGVKREDLLSDKRKEYNGIEYRMKTLSKSFATPANRRENESILLWKKWMYDDNGQQIDIAHLGMYLCNPAGLANYVYNHIPGTGELSFYISEIQDRFGTVLNDRELNNWFENHLWTLSVSITRRDNFIVPTRISISGPGGLLSNSTCYDLYPYTSSDRFFNKPDVLKYLPHLSSRRGTLSEKLPLYSLNANY